MTCIAALKHEGDVWVGGDSAGVAGYGMSVRADEKVFRNGPMVMGFTTSFRMGQLLRYELTVPEQTPSMDDYAYLVGPFVNAVRKVLKDGGFASKKDEAEHGGTFIVGYRGRLYYVDSDYQIGEPADGFTAVGCGDDIALGSLYSTVGEEHQLSPERRIRIALQAAERFSAGVRGPFKVVNLGVR